MKKDDRHEAAPNYLPAKLLLDIPSIDDGAVYRFDDNGEGQSLAVIKLPFTEKRRANNLRTVAALEVERRCIGEESAYAVGIVQTNDVAITRTHYSDLPRFLGVENIFPVFNQHRIGLLSTSKTNEVLRLAQLQSTFEALGNTDIDDVQIPTAEQTAFHMAHAGHLQNARDILMRGLIPVNTRPKGPVRSLGVIDGGTRSP